MQYLETNKINILIERFNLSIDGWLQSIQLYSFKQLCMQPVKKEWSLGQVCMHLLNDTNWFIEQINICLSSNDNFHKTMAESAKTIFENNSFPDKKLENPANENMPQPATKGYLLDGFIQLKKNIVAGVIKSNHSNAKTKHPGFGYFNATEWLQFAEMHLRHHIKQKERIEAYLQKIST